MAVLNNEHYEPISWQGSLVYWAVLLLTVAVNTLGVRYPPHIEMLAFNFYVAAFLRIFSSFGVPQPSEHSPIRFY